MIGRWFTSELVAGLAVVPTHVPYSMWFVNHTYSKELFDPARVREGYARGREEFACRERWRLARTGREGVNFLLATGLDERVVPHASFS